MIAEFNGFTKGVIGKKLPADATLNNMKKSELIELLHLAQHNYDTLMQFYTNAVNVNIKELNKSDKERLLKETLDNAISTYETVIKYAGDIDDEDYSPILDKAILDKVTLSFLQELKQYRELEEQGLLLRLPVAVGSKVFSMV